MYDQDKDKFIKLFEFTQNNDQSLLLSIMQYGTGKPKLQITRSYKKKNGELGYSQAGRLTLEEVQFMKKNIDEILKFLH